MIKSKVKLFNSSTLTEFELLMENFTHIQTLRNTVAKFGNNAMCISPRLTSQGNGTGFFRAGVNDHKIFQHGTPEGSRLVLIFIKPVTKLYNLSEQYYFIILYDGCHKFKMFEYIYVSISKI